VAALATILWAKTGEGTLHSLAYNVIFIASISTILFNANPLLKFDGYYIFTDLIGVPNLYQRAQHQVKYLMERYLLGVKQAETAADDPREFWVLALYGVLSGIYRVIIFAGIILFVGDQYLILGLLMAIFMVFSWVVRPPMKLVKYLITSPKLEHSRKRVIGIVIGLLLMLFGFFGGVPMPDHFRASGVLQSVNFKQISIGIDGSVETLLSEPGALVEEGTPLIRMSNWEVENQLKIVEAQWRQVVQEEKRARSQDIADIAPILERKKSILSLQEQLLVEQGSLLVQAQQPGRWVAPNLEYLVGTWLQRGSPLGLIIDEERFHFIAVIPQDEASSLFEEEIHLSEIRMKGEQGKNIVGTMGQIIPYRHERLPSPALGWNGGGDIAVNSNDESGVKAEEPFFVIKIDVDKTDFSTIETLHGRTGTVRFTLSTKPLLVQWVRDLRQVLQRRYQL
jgi:putative peptide zinc metalloprotease protein